MSNKDQTTRSFGNKWLTDAGRNYGKKEEVLEQFLSIFGVEREEDLKEIFKDGMTCLEAGCGVGWAEEIFNVNENVDMYAVDISDSVEVAKKRTAHMKNVRVMKADIKNLPFQKEFFDIIFSNGVLHHTGDTEGYFTKLCGHLKKGGFIGVYIYNKKPFIRSLSDEFIRKHTTNLPFAECLDFSETLSKLGKAFQQIEDKLVIEDDIPLLGIKSGEYNLQSFIYNYFLKCFYNKEWGLALSTSVNVDWYHPKVVTFHSIEEITGWFKKNNIIKDIKILQPKGWEHSGWFVSGRKFI